MTSPVIVGNKSTYISDDLMITTTGIQTVNDGRLLIFGGTSDARVCSVSAWMHRESATGSRSPPPQAVSRQPGLQGEIREGRMDAQAMAEYRRRHGIRPAGGSRILTPPCSATLFCRCSVSWHSAGAVITARVILTRLDNPLIYKTDSIDSAREIAMTPRSADFADHRQQTAGGLYCPRCRAKTVLARVLLTQEVLAQCESYG